jgi:subtilase family serine protease
LTRGNGQIVAVVDAYDNPDVATDLAEYRSVFSLPKARFSKYNQNGKMRDYPKGDKGWGVEIDNDVEMVSASCPRCEVYLVEANSNSWSDIEAAEAEAITLGAHIVSNSFEGTGASESYWDTPGITYVASSGNPFVDPATFVNVVAVGGTVLSKGGGTRGWTESVWSNAGGGCSSLDEQRPSWQRGRYTRSCAYRVGNDVSAVADGVAIYDSYGSYGWVSIAGTQIGAPFLSGVFALAGNARKQDGGRTFWESSHHKYLYEVEDKGRGRRFSYVAGWGTPNGIDAF